MTQAPKVGDWVVRKTKHRHEPVQWSMLCRKLNVPLDAPLRVKYCRGPMLRIEGDDYYTWRWDRFDIVQPIVEKSLEDYM